MKVVITGGCGFLGQMIAKAILKRGELRGPDGKLAEVDEIQLFDQLAPVTPFAWADKRVTTAAGDISDKATVSALVDRDDVSVFHLASVVSAGGEKDFDMAMRVNLMGGLNILDAARARGSAPRLVFSSSLAVFGGPDLPKEVDDWTRHTPETTYGMTKAFGELAINDYTRKGFIDGRTVRLPTIVIRPGVPNAAASGWASGIFREPLQGKEHVLPVHDGFYMMLLGYRSAVEGFLAVHEAEG
ncbi:MAG: NAD-dependent epimerase/dehydratase family protein, partial [Rhodospirillales bacterium]